MTVDTATSSEGRQMDPIYHIAFAADWQHAQQAGEYLISTRGVTLDQQGYIHASQAQQVELVANAIYRDAADLIILTIDPALLRSELRYEKMPDADDPFPHIYGPLNTDAVIDTAPFVLGPDGSFSFAR
jgi:glutathione S-transferase